MGISDSIPMYFCTVSDERHYGVVLNFIGRMYKLHYDDISEINVYDLGLTEQERHELNNIRKVKVCEIEKTNPHMFDFIQTGPNTVLCGLFSWRPVVIKQALDKYPYVLYLDPGTTILNPLTGLFKHIMQNGYFINDCGHSIKWMATKTVIERLKVESELLADDVFGIDTGFMGVSQSVYDSFIKPVYDLSFDITNFVDDGTCPQGYGCGGYDQTLFSIQARRLGLKINNHDREPCEAFLEYDGLREPIYITHNPRRVNEKTTIFRWDINETQSGLDVAAEQLLYVAKQEMENGNTNSAIEYFENALRISNHNRTTVLAYGEMLITKAKEIFTLGLISNPDDSEILSHRRECENILAKVNRLNQPVVMEHKVSIPIWVLNLKRDTERLLFMKRQLEQLNLKFRVIEAVDGESLTDADLQAYYSRDAAIEFGRELSRGEIGCALSHARIWALMIEEQHQELLVLEDDIMISSPLIRILESTFKLPRDYEFINFATDAQQLPFGDYITENYRASIHLRCANGCCAYLINLKGAHKLLSKALPIYLAADGLTGRTYITGLVSYGISPRVAFLSDFQSTIGIRLPAF